MAALALEHFSQLATLGDWRPLRFADGFERIKLIGESAALVKREADEPGQLVESVGIPLAARNEDGDNAPLDFRLRAQEAGWDIENPVVDMSLPKQLSDGVLVDEVRVLARSAGGTQGFERDGKVFYPDAAVDTDFAIVPIPTGIETFWQLRSPESPEVHRLDLRLPDGARLGAAAAGGAEVHRDGRRLTTVLPPAAQDSQGRNVPVSTSVGPNGVIEFSIEHRDQEYAYPILLDPSVVDDWATGNYRWDGAGEWQTVNNSSPTSFGFPTGGSFGPGRYVHAPPGIYYIGQYGSWEIDAYGDSFFGRAEFKNNVLFFNSPGNDRNNHWFEIQEGIWNPSQNRWNAIQTFPYQTVPGQDRVLTPDYGNTTNPDWRKGEKAVFRLSSGAQFGRSYWTEAFFGGAVLWTEDHGKPAIARYTPGAETTRWLDDETTTVEADGKDTGTGLVWFDVYGPGIHEARRLNDAAGNPCSGARASRCPHDATANYSWQGSELPQGNHRFGISAVDVVGWNSEQKYWQVKVDRSPPALDFRGSTLHQGGLTMTGSTYTLNVKATDGSRVRPADERSGVKSVEVLVRRDSDLSSGRVSAPFVRKWFSGDLPCTHAQSSCELTRSETFRRADYAPGEYTVRVVAKDQLGHPEAKDFSFFVPPPATSAREADRIGLEDWWQYDSSETGAGTRAHVNLSNGNLVWHSTPITNLGRGLSTVVNLTYNSHRRKQLPLEETPVEQLLGPYDEVGSGFSLGVSGITRLNERLNVDLAAAGRITLTDRDGTRHVFKGEQGLASEVFTPPPGVQLHLRRYSLNGALINAPMFGFEKLEKPDKAWAATRPDGVTYYFDQRGYQKSIEDRSGNVLRFVYDYRGPTRDACRAAERLDVNIFVLPGRVCPYKVTEVWDSAKVAGSSTKLDLSITYNARALADLPPELQPPDPAPPLAPSYVEPPGSESGRVKTITYAGREMRFDYEGGRLTGTTEAANNALYARSFAFGYEAQPSGTPLKVRPLTSVTDPRGAVTRVAYKPNPNGLDSATELLAFDRPVQSIVDRNESRAGGSNEATEFTIDRSAGTASVKDARDHDTTYRLDGRGRMTEMIDARGAKTAMTWDDADSDSIDTNSPSQITRAAGSADESTVTMVHNANGLLTSSTDQGAGGDRTTTLRYRDFAGLVAHRSPRTGAGGASIDAGRGFVSDVEELRRPEGNKTTFSYVDEVGVLRDDGLVRRQTDGEGNAVTTAYGSFGLPASERDEVGNTTTFVAYEGNGLPTEVKDPKGGVWRYRYNGVGGLLAATDPRGDGRGGPADPAAPFTTTLTSDSFDRVVTEKIPERSEAGAFRSNSYVYDKNGNLERETLGSTGAWVRGYSPMDAPATETSPSTEAAPGGETTRQLFDDEENVVKRVSPRGMADGSDADDAFATEFRYDSANQRTAAIRHSTYGTQGGRSEVSSLASSWAYDLRGNVVGVSDPAHNQSVGGLPETNAQIASRRRFSYAYDKADNRIAEVEDPEGEDLTTSYSFDANDNPVSVTDPRSNTTSYRYDGRDLRTDVVDPLGKRTHYGLREDGKLAFEVTPRGTAGIAEDAAPASYTSFRTNYTYDANGDLTRKSIPKAPNQYAGLERDIVWGRDAVGDPTTITDARGNAFANTFYDTGELKSTERPSWWKFEPGTGEQPEVRERSWAEMIRSTGERPELPKSEGEGDFGAVDPVRRPELLPRAGQAAFDYDDEMRLTTVTDTEGKQSVLGRDELGRVTKVEQPLDASAGRYITRELLYDPNGNVRAEIDRGAWRQADGSEADLRTDLTFDQYDRLVARDEPGETAGTREVTDLTLDPNGNVDKRDTARGSLAWEYDYDALDRMTFSENPAHERTGYGYDRAGNRTSETSPRGMAKPAADRGPFTTTRVFGARNELASTTNGLGNATSYGYDPDGNQDSVDAPGADNRILTRRTFDGRGLPWSETVGTGTNQRTTVTEYDPNGNLRRTVNPAGVDESTKRPKNPWDGAAVSASASDNATVHEHTPANLLTGSWLPTGDVDGAGPADGDPRRFRQDFSYDTRGRVRTVSSPYRPDVSCSSTGPPNEGCTSTVLYTHFDSGWARTQSDPELRDPDGGALRYDQMLVYDYDRRGNQVTWRTPRGQADKRVVTRHYAPNGTLSQRVATDSEAGAPRSYGFTYNANRSRTSMRDEQLGRTTRIYYDDAERPLTVDETWDPRPPGDPDQRSDASRDVAFGYDTDGNVTERRTDGTLATGSDPASYSGGKTTGFVYDTIGRETDTLVCMSGPAVCSAAGADRKTTTEYFPSDAVRERTKPNAVVETLTFNDDGRIARMKRNKGSATGTELKDQPYGYDPNANRTTDERGAHRFNPRDQLVHWTRGAKAKSPGSTVAYELNGSGAIKQKVDSATPGGTTTTTFEYLGANGDRLDNVTASQPGALSSSADYSYDEFGAVELIDPDVGESSSYDYDEFGRMTESRAPGLEGDKDFRYDALDRRDSRVEDPDTPAISKTLDYSYVGLGEELAREELAGGKAKTYDYDSQLRRQGQTTKLTAAVPGSYRSYGTDANGSVEGLEDSDGDIRECAASEPICRTDRYRYDPYGELEDKEADLSEEAKDNPFRFEGFYYDSGLKQYDMRARPYRPDIGRFMTQDRFEASAGDFALQSDALTQNRYAFAGGNPVNNIEFDGHYAGTSDQNSRHIQLGNGDSYDRSAGKRTSGPSEGEGPGRSGYVDRSNPTASSKPYFARQIARLPAARAVIGTSGNDPAALQRLSAGRLLELNNEVETEQFRRHSVSSENPTPTSPFEVAAFLVNPCKAAAPLCRAAAKPVVAAGQRVVAEGSKRLGPIARRILGKQVAGAADNLAGRVPPYGGGKTQGALEVGGRQVDLISGRAGPAANISKGTPGFDAYVRTHVEGHAAAILRQQGGGRARLAINQVPCANCDRNLSRALPEGAELQVLGPGGFRKTYRGLPD